MEKTRRDDAVKGREQESCSSITIATLAVGLLLISGCATAGKGRMEPAQPLPAVAAAPSPSLPKGPSVVHFTDGREGFVITEPSGMNALSRADFHKASAMIKEGNYDMAIELLEKVSAQWPEMTAPHINVAIAYRQVNKPEQAEQHLKKALESFPGHPVASNEYGLLLRKAGRFAESRQMYEKSLAAFPEYQPMHRNLGILCDLYLKDLACAAEHYEIYGNAMPRDEQVKLWLADLQTRNVTAVAGLKLPIN